MHLARMPAATPVHRYRSTRGRSSWPPNAITYRDPIAQRVAPCGDDRQARPLKLIPIRPTCGLRRANRVRAEPRRGVLDAVGNGRRALEVRQLGDVGREHAKRRSRDARATASRAAVVDARGMKPPT